MPCNTIHFIQNHAIWRSIPCVCKKPLYNPKFFVFLLVILEKLNLECFLMSSYSASDKITNHLGQIWFDSEACIVFRRWKRWIYQPTLGLRFQMTRWAFLGSFSATSTRPLSAGSFHCGHTALRNRFGCHDMLSPANDYCSPHLGPLPPSLPSLLPLSFLLHRVCSVLPPGARPLSAPKMVTVCL